MILCLAVCNQFCTLEGVACAMSGSNRERRGEFHMQTQLSNYLIIAAFVWWQLMPCCTASPEYQLPSEDTRRWLNGTMALQLLITQRWRSATTRKGCQRISTDDQKHAQCCRHENTDFGKHNKFHCCCVLPRDLRLQAWHLEALTWLQSIGRQSSVHNNQCDQRNMRKTYLCRQRMPVGSCGMLLSWDMHAQQANT